LYLQELEVQIELIFLVPLPPFLGAKIHC